MLVAAPLYLAHKFSDEVLTSRLGVNQLVRPVSGRSLARRRSSIGRRGGLEIQDTRYRVANPIMSGTIGCTTRG